MPDEPQPASQAWFRSSQIRVALVMFVPLFIRVAQRTIIGAWLKNYLGFDIGVPDPATKINAVDIVNWLMAVIAASGGGFWIHKRVQAGKNPQSDAPEIVPPKIVQRLTGNVPIQRPVPPPPPDDIRYHPYTGEAMTAADFDALVARMLKPDDPPKRG